MHDQTDGVVEVRNLIDPEVAVALEALPIDIGGLLDGLSAANIADVRAAFAQMPVPELSRQRRTNRPRRRRARRGLSVRVHRPIAVEGELPCVYWMHGGGLVLGSHVGDDLRFDVWCQRHACIGVSVDYRLAPETPYPGPLDDCYAGLAWIHAHAAELGVDPTRIGIGGASAGGGLAAGLALLAP